MLTSAEHKATRRPRLLLRFLITLMAHPRCLIAVCEELTLGRSDKAAGEPNHCLLRAVCFTRETSCYAYRNFEACSYRPLTKPHGSDFYYPHPRFLKLIVATSDLSRGNLLCNLCDRRIPLRMRVSLRLRIRRATCRTRRLTRFRNGTVRVDGRLVDRADFNVFCVIGKELFPIG